MTRFALGLQYTGTRYSGWQRQPHQPMTVQQELEQALSFVANEEIVVNCAGRTDAGVHATSQVVHFNTTAKRPLRAWLLGTNTKLPPDISVQWAHEVGDDFHARFSARHRRYRYIIYNYPQRPGIYQNQVTWHLHPLQLEAMQQAANHLVGEHDFNAYRSVHCQAKHARRNIHFLRLTQQGKLIICDIQANGFLHHMVRNIIGVLLEIGSGSRLPIWAQQVLNSGDRCQGGVTAPASGLYLTEVAYPEEFQLPQEPFQPFFLSPVLL